MLGGMGTKSNTPAQSPGSGPCPLQGSYSRGLSWGCALRPPRVNKCVLPLAVTHSPDLYDFLWFYPTTKSRAILRRTGQRR
jgi:hypothetical protein